MNNHRTLLAILLVGLASCQPPEGVKSPGASRTKDDAGIIPFGGHAHQYPLESSLRLLSNLARTSELSRVPADFGWGGSFPVDAFRVATADQGVMLWYCYRGGSNPQLFLALEHLRDYDPHNMPTAPESDELLVPSTVFHYDLPEGRDEDAMREFLSNQTGDQPQWITVPTSEIRGYINSADSLFNEMVDSQGERYNNYMFGFFSVRHEAAFDEFLNKAGKNGYIRYYFGYDENDRPNRIRIILMAVSADGVNTALSKTLDDGGSTMQRSWPPPPDN